jgi:holo-ACP synthase
MESLGQHTSAPPAWSVCGHSTKVGGYLEARDARHVLILEACRLARERTQGAVIVVSVNIPGPDKNRPGLEALVERGTVALGARGIGGTPVFAGTDLLGPYRILVAPGPAAQIKAAAVELEGGLPGGRVLDVDVLMSDGEPVDRRTLGLAPRCCYVCDRPARECILLGRHRLAELLAAVDAHLALASAL